LAFEPKNSSDINCISNKLIKFLKFEIAEPLVYIFSLSISSGSFPSRLKTSRTVPIFKSGDHLLCDNYCPISLLPTISKILEKAMAKRLTNHLKENNLLCQNQFGFQEKMSTVHHLLKLTNYITTELNKKRYVVGVFLDLRKAFDVFPHDILLNKLQKLGIEGTALEWFRSYLSGRSQKVDINGTLLDFELITISILQGSILGPILFLCFINDLPCCIDLFTLLFADYTASLSSGPELGPLLNKVNGSGPTGWRLMLVKPNILFLNLRGGEWNSMTMREYFMTTMTIANHMTSVKYQNLIEYLMTTPSLVTEPINFWASIWTKTYPLTHILAMSATNYHNLIT
jgi:hypothetical protein